MSTFYLNNPSKPIRPPHSNDCNGHNTSISVGEGKWTLGRRRMSLRWVKSRN